MLIPDFPSWRQAPDVRAQPEMLIVAWRVFKDQSGERFLVGLLPNGITLRTTTPIVIVNVVSRSWLTQSGRLYQTPGPPTQDIQLQETMRLLVQAGGVCGALSDATEEIWAAMQRAVQ